MSISNESIELTRPLNISEQCPSCGSYTEVEYKEHFASIACCGRQFLVGYDGKKIHFTQDTQ